MCPNVCIYNNFINTIALSESQQANNSTDENSTLNDSGVYKHEIVKIPMS